MILSHEEEKNLTQMADRGSVSEIRHTQSADHDAITKAVEHAPLTDSNPNELRDKIRRLKNIDKKLDE